MPNLPASEPFYLELDIADARDRHGSVTLWVEVAPNGLHLREVGFDKDGNAVHRYPDAGYPEGVRGFLDFYPTEPEDGVTLAPEDFGIAWSSMESISEPGRRIGQSS